MRTGVACSIVFLAGCLEPTEIVVQLSTDVPCDLVAKDGVEISIGASGDEDAGVVTVAKSCDGGSIGTIVLTPRPPLRNAQVRTVLGVGVPSSECRSQNYAKCIVARRSLGFVSHAKLVLPISLDQDCVGQPCDPASTCVNGQCVPSDAICDGGSCNPPPPPPLDGSAPPACVDVPPSVIGTMADPMSPRIARTSDGWAIAWSGPFGNIHLVDIGLDANKMVKPVRGPWMFTPNPSLEILGPLGSDGARHALAYLDPTPQLNIWEIDGQGMVTNMPTAGSTAPALAGMIWNPGFWMTIDVQGTPLLVKLVPGKTIEASPAISIGNADSAAISGSNGTYYVGMHAMTGGSAHRCVYTTSFTCMPLWMDPTAVAAKVAASGSYMLIVYVQQQQSLGVTTLKRSYALGAVDTTDAFLPIALGNNTVRVLWQFNGDIVTSAHDPTTMAAPPPSKLAMKIDPGGFDAVADDPNGLGYAVVHNSNGNVMFVHKCQ